MSVDRALFRALPRLHDRVPWFCLGTLPTPVDPLPGAGPAVWVKRDDFTATLYGGNKVRTLEPLFGRALARGARTIFATGAYGSNHALATVLHAPAAGLGSGAILFPQPPSKTARANFEVLLARAGEVQALRTMLALPFAMWRTRARAEHPEVMAPGGAIPAGTLGYVSAALEVAEQVQAGRLPAPDRVVLPVGSTCTSAGLLLGFHVAQRVYGLPPPALRSVRVTPWPVTAAFRIIGLAVRAGRLLASLAEDPTLVPTAADLRRRLTVDGEQLGRGYGHPTPAGEAAIATLGAALTLDTTYSAKAAAAMLSHPIDGPTLFWDTKSHALPADRPDAASLPPHVRAWLDRCPPV